MQFSLSDQKTVCALSYALSGTWAGFPLSGAWLAGCAVKLVDDLAGASPASASFPVGTVVISGDGAGDQTVGSPDVNVLVGRTQVWSAPTGGLAKQQVVAKANRRQASKTHPHQDRSVRTKGTPKLFYPRLKARVFGEALGKSNRRVPRGLRGRHVVKEHQ